MAEFFRIPAWIMEDEMIRHVRPELFCCWMRLVCAASNHVDNSLPSFSRAVTYLREDKMTARGMIMELLVNGMLEELPDGRIIPNPDYFKPIGERLPSHEWKAIRAYVFERDHYACHYCGAVGRPLECDHVLPVSRGGSNDWDNLVTACRPCNRAKRAKTPKEWRR